VPKTLVTGATGFIGSHVARELAGRGDELRVTIRSESSPKEALADIEHEEVKCDLLDRRAVRRAVTGVERVFHCAGLVSLRERDAERVFQVNALATRTLLEECLRAEVERVVFTSSVAAIGPAPRGGTADETQVFTAGHLGIPYVNSKHEAETEALRLAAHGLPLVSTSAGIDGTGVTPGREALVSDDLGDYPELLAAVLDPCMNERMSEACLDLYETDYSPEAVSQQYRHVFMT